MRNLYPRGECVRIRADGDDVFVQFASGDAGHDLHADIGRKSLAPGKQQHACREQSYASTVHVPGKRLIPRRAHRFCFGAMGSFCSLQACGSTGRWRT